MKKAVQNGDDWCSENGSRLTAAKAGGLFTLRLHAAGYSGRELALFRDWFKDHPSAKRVVIDLADVTHLESGFFGMLYDQRDRGISLRLLNASEQIQGMTWYRKFVRQDGVFARN